MQQIPVSLLTLIAGVLIALFSLWVGQYTSFLMPVQASEQAPLVDDFFKILVIIGTGLFVVVQGAIIIFLYQYRHRRGDDRDGEPIEGNFALEVFWTAVPSIIVIGLGIYSVDVYSQMGGLGVGSHHTMMSHSSTASPGTAMAASLNDSSDIETLSEPIQAPVESTIAEPAQAVIETPTQTSTETVIEEPAQTSAEVVIQEPTQTSLEVVTQEATQTSTQAVTEEPTEVRIQVPAKTTIAAPQLVEPSIGIGAKPQVEGRKADLLVNVTGMQFAWIFNYPDSEVTSGELHVPVGADVQLNITANDVIHALWIPQFRLKQDAIPGQPTELRFVATRPGTYPIVCAELCGGYHGSMRTQVIVHPKDEFNNWLESNRIAQLF